MFIGPVATSAINRVVGAVSVAAGLAFLLGGGYWLHRNHLDEFIFKRGIAEGRVIEVRCEHYYTRDSSGSRTSYRAIVQFTDPWGQVMTHADSIAFNPPSFSMGQRVAVFYDPQNPERAMIDRGLKNYLIPLICGVFGGLMILGGLQRLWSTRSG